MHAWQFAKAQHVAAQNGWTPFVSMQNHWNLLYREEEREMVGVCRDQGIGVIPWSPLARGRLARGPGAAEPTLRAETDKFGKVLYAAMEEADKRVLTELDTIAKARRLPHAQVALSWLLQKDSVTSPIVGATKMQHLDDAVGALQVKLSPDEVKALEAPYVPHPVAGFSG
jgi:aryl-alcohol dehydrogenase-like predicted oxidoreductase